MAISYTKVGDYLLPNLTLTPKKGSYGKWGMIRKRYLKEHREVLYNQLLLQDELHEHLCGIDEQARGMHESIMDKLEKGNPPPAQGTMEWVQWKNGLCHQADEIVLNDLIYS